LSHGRTTHEKFRLSELGRVHWPSTLKLALARGFAAGVIWSALLSLTPNAPREYLLFVMPFIWAAGATPIGMSIQFLSQITPLAGGWFGLLGSFIVCLGDPLVYVLNRAWPDAINVADLELFNLRPFIFVMLPD
jgi:hypothetical protein